MATATSRAAGERVSGADVERHERAVRLSGNHSGINPISRDRVAACAIVAHHDGVRYRIGSTRQMSSTEARPSESCTRAVTTTGWFVAGSVG